jgi:hypothetical protein
VVCKNRQSEENTAIKCMRRILEQAEWDGPLQAMGTVVAEQPWRSRTEGSCVEMMKKVTGGVMECKHRVFEIPACAVKIWKILELREAE